MTLILLPSPTNTHTIDVAVALVGAVPRIGFFDANGMLLDSSFETHVSDASSTTRTCRLNLNLQASGMQMFVHAKQGSPVTLWAPNRDNTSVSQTIEIGAGSYPNGVASSFNVAVAQSWGAADAIWVDPTWPLGRAGSGGPKALGAPAEAASYFYLPSLGSSSNPVQLQLYVNVALSGSTPYAWLSNAQGVCVGNTMVLCPPVGASTSDDVFCHIVLQAGTIPSGYAVKAGSQPLPTNINIYQALNGTSSDSISLAIMQGTTTLSTTMIGVMCMSQAPGPVWT
jgi:hypothetical protein